MKFLWILLVCWWKGHNWTEDYPITLGERFQVFAGMWFPKAHCKRCDAKRDSINEKLVLARRTEADLEELRSQAEGLKKL